MGSYDPHVLMGEAQGGQRLGKDVPLRVGRLGSGPDGQPARKVELADGAVGLNGTVGIAGHVITVFQDVIGLGEAFFRVPLPHLSPVGDIGLCLGEKPGNVFVIAEVRMNEDGVFPEGLHLVEYLRKLFVGHLDQARRLFGGLGAAGNHGGHLFSVKTHLVLGEDVTILHVEAKPVTGKVPCREDVEHPVHFQCVFHINGDNFGTRLRASDDMGM